VGTAEIGSDQGKELIHWGGGTVVASYIDRVEARWRKERMAQALIAGIDFYARRAKQRRSFLEETRLEWINIALQRLDENYPKPPIILR
jgi:hypothetical protein